MAKTIIVLEHHDSSEGFTLGSSVLDHSALVKKREIDSDVSSVRRDVLKFYRKRISCKCLKRMQLDARKTISKMGRCFNCKIEKERVNLSVCSKCMVTQYCSRECQVARWPGHKMVCDKRYQYNLKKQIEEKEQQVVVKLNDIEQTGEKLEQTEEELQKTKEELKKKENEKKEDQAVFEELGLELKKKIAELEAEKAELEAENDLLQKKTEEQEETLAELGKC